MAFLVPVAHGVLDSVFLHSLRSITCPCILITKGIFTLSYLELVFFICNPRSLN